MKSFRLLKINESSVRHVSCSNFGFFGKKVTILRKNLKIDNFSYSIKNKAIKIKSSNIVKKYGLVPVAGDLHRYQAGQRAGDLWYQLSPHQAGPEPAPTPLR